VLGVLYESYIHPITIISTLPSAGVGALLALIICRQDFSVIALIGLCSDRHRQEERDHDDRFRARRRAERGQTAGGSHLPGVPAALPSDHDDDMAALLAGVPLALGTGTDRSCAVRSDHYHRGLIFSQALTLFTTPVIYLWFERLARRFSHAPEHEAAHGGNLAKENRVANRCRREASGAKVSLVKP